MKHTKSILFAAATAAMALAAPMASATPVDLQYQTADNVFRIAPGAANLNASTSVNVSTNAGLSIAVSANAGAFAMQQTPGGDNTTLLPGKFLAFCLDLFGSMNNNKSYTVTDTPFVGNPLSGTQKALINRLFDVFDGTANMLSNTALTAATQSVAMQLALWEIVYETDAAAGFNVKTGDLQITNLALTDQIIVDANNLLNAAVVALNNPNHVRVWNAVYLQKNPTNATNIQSLVAVAPVPLPAAIFMLLGAIAGLVGVRRFRKEAAA